MCWTDTFSARRSKHIGNNATNILKNTLLFQTIKVKYIRSSWNYWCLFSHRILQTSKNITTMFREQKPITVSDRLSFWGLSKASNSSSTLLEAHMLPVHRETKLLTPTWAAERSLYFLHVQLLGAHFPSAASLGWCRSVPEPRVTARSPTPTRCPLRTTQKAAFILGWKGAFIPSHTQVGTLRDHAPFYFFFF